jgi:hypothetical protein
LAFLQEKIVMFAANDPTIDAYVEDSSETTGIVKSVSATFVVTIRLDGCATVGPAWFLFSAVACTLERVKN